VSPGRHRLTRSRNRRNGTTPRYHSVEADELLASPALVVDPISPTAPSHNGGALHARGAAIGANGSTATAAVPPASNGHVSNGDVGNYVGNGYVGNGNGNGNGGVHPAAADPTELHTQPVDPGEVPPVLQGAGLIRYGLREIGTGLTDLLVSGLDLVRGRLPTRLRTIRRQRVAALLVVVMALLIAVAAVAARTVAARLGGPTSVVVATAAPAVIHNQPGGVGSISAAPQDIATVSLNVQGITAPIQITAVDVLANQLVPAGAPLLQLNPTPFQQNLLQVKTTLEQSEQTLDSARTAAGNVTAAAGGYLAVQIPTLEGQVALNQQLVQIAEGNSTTITSPIAGYVSQVRVAPGQIVNPGNTLVQVVNPAQIVVNAGMQLSDLPSIAVGDAATITPSQLPGVHLRGTVAAISAAATGDGLEGTVVVSAPNLTTHPVPIGTQSIVNIAAPLQAAISVPTLAVLNVQIAPVVGVIRHGRIHFQPVRIGASDGTRTQILSGLLAGDRVAVSNLQYLTDGDKVRPASGGS
jgi:RND family efflux transporter MFP subunit